MLWKLIELKDTEELLPSGEGRVNIMLKTLLDFLLMVHIYIYTCTRVCVCVYVYVYVYI